MEIITVGEAARLLGIQRHRLNYAIETGKVPQPRQTIMGARRFYTREDVEEIRRLLEKRGRESPERP